MSSELEKVFMGPEKFQSQKRVPMDPKMGRKKILLKFLLNPFAQADSDSEPETNFLVLKIFTFPHKFKPWPHDT